MAATVSCVTDARLFTDGAPAAACDFVFGNLNLAYIYGGYFGEGPPSDTPRF